MDIGAFERFREFGKEYTPLKNDVEITFTLPDGKTLTASFPSTQTVGFLKAHLVRHLDYVYDLIELHTDTMELPDPFSLVDVGIGPGSKKDITVIITGEIDPRFLHDDMLEEEQSTENKQEETIETETQVQAPTDADEYSDDFDTFEED